MDAKFFTQNGCFHFGRKNLVDILSVPKVDIFFAARTGGLSELMGIWSERVARPGVYLEFADVVLRSWKTEAPLSVLCWSEGFEIK